MRNDNDVYGIKSEGMVLDYIGVRGINKGEQVTTREIT